MDTAREEQTASVASFIYDRALGSLPVFPFSSYLFIKRGDPNVCTPMIFAGGLLSGETSGIAEIPQEVMEALAPALETIATMQNMGVQLPFRK